MKKVIVRVKDTNKLKTIKEFGCITYVSKVMNYIEMEIGEADIQKLHTCDNVLAVNVSAEGEYQPCCVR